MKTVNCKRITYFLILGVVLSGCLNEILEQDQSITNGSPELKSASEWERVFTDNFDVNGDLSQWIAAERFDYNSRVCKYLASIPTIATYENLSCLVITATKNGKIWNSGFLTSNFSFKPDLNQEYHTSARIKFTAVNNGGFVDFAETYGAWPAFWTVQGHT